jgi:hypothetical protein
MNPEEPQELPANQPPQPLPPTSPQVSPQPPAPEVTESTAPAPTPQTFQAPPPPPNSSQDPKLPSAFTLFKPSWVAIKLNIVTLASLYFIPLILSLFSVFKTHRLSRGYTFSNNTHSGLSVALILFLLLIEIIIGAPLVYTIVKSAQGITVSLSEAFKEGFGYVWRFYGLVISLVVIIGLGFILIIVPGVFLLKRYYLAPYAMFSENLGIKESMKRSAQLGKDHDGVWGVIGVQALISLFSIIPIIGWLISTVGGISYICAPAIRFEQLKALDGNTPTKNSNPTAAPATPTLTPAI